MGSVFPAGSWRLLTSVCMCGRERERERGGRERSVDGLVVVSPLKPVIGERFQLVADVFPTEYQQIFYFYQRTFITNPSFLSREEIILT